MELFLPAEDEQSIQRQLHELDDRLILTRERDHLGRDYYVVIYYQGGSIPPDYVLDWRDQDDTPRPLSSAMPNEVRKMMQQGPPDVKEIIKLNEARKQKLDDEREEERLEMALEFERHRKRSGAVHRSVGLRMARDKMRARGKKV